MTDHTLSSLPDQTPDSDEKFLSRQPWNTPSLLRLNEAPGTPLVKPRGFDEVTIGGIPTLEPGPS